MKDQNAQPSIELHIERVVLSGLAVDQERATAIGESVKSELSRLLAEGGFGADGGALSAPSLHADAIQWSPSTPVDRLGSRIAWAVYGCLNQVKR
jgi:hypothetical protein